MSFYISLLFFNIYYIFLSQQNRQVSKGNDSDSHLYSTMFEANVLAAMSAETASFPHEPYDQINGECIGGQHSNREIRIVQLF